MDGTMTHCRIYLPFLLLWSGALSMAEISILKGKTETIDLPGIQENSSYSLEKSIAMRRSARNYKKDALTLQEISQLLWAAQGITDKRNDLRAAPSAGALYPLEIYLIVGNVDGLDAGVYKYEIGKHKIKKVIDGDQRSALSSAALSQGWVKIAPAALVICGIYARTRRKYGERGTQYVHMEVGAVAENVYLQGRALGIGTAFVGAFDEDQVQSVIAAASDEVPFAVLPLGKI